MKAIQYFSDEYLERCADLSADEIASFLDDFRQVHGRERSTQPSGKKKPSKLISLKVPEDLLAAFRVKADLNGVKYQTQIKALMQDWLSKGAND